MKTSVKAILLATVSAASLMAASEAYADCTVTSPGWGQDSNYVVTDCASTSAMDAALAGKADASALAGKADVSVTDGIQDQITGIGGVNDKLAGHGTRLDTLETVTIPGIQTQISGAGGLQDQIATNKADILTNHHDIGALQNWQSSLSGGNGSVSLNDGDGGTSALTTSGVTIADKNGNVANVNAAGANWASSKGSVTINADPSITFTTPQSQAIVGALGDQAGMGASNANGWAIAGVSGSSSGFMTGNAAGTAMLGTSGTNGPKLEINNAGGTVTVGADNQANVISQGGIIGATNGVTSTGFTGGGFVTYATPDGTGPATFSVDAPTGNVTTTGTVKANSITDGAGTTISGGTVTAGTLTDGTATISGGAVTAVSVSADQIVTGGVNVGSKLASHDNTLADHNTRITANTAKNVEQDGRLDGHDTALADHDGRITANTNGVAATNNRLNAFAPTGYSSIGTVENWAGDVNNTLANYGNAISANTSGIAHLNTLYSAQQLQINTLGSQMKKVQSATAQSIAYQQPFVDVNHLIGFTGGWGTANGDANAFAGMGTIRFDQHWTGSVGAAFSQDGTWSAKAGFGAQF